MEIGSGIKPEVELLLPVALALGINIGMKCIRVTGEIPQEFKVYLIPRRALGFELKKERTQQRKSATNIKYM